MTGKEESSFDGSLTESRVSWKPTA